MHRFVAGTCRMQLSLTARQPWMVRGEIAGNQTHVLTDRFNRPLLPASSFKGVLRSTAERILRSMHPERDSNLAPLADDPFVHSEDAMPGLRRGEVADSELDKWNDKSQRYAKEALAPAQVYTVVSAASQLFGCTLHAGLVTLSDMQAADAQPAPRPHVAIDRFTGGVGQGPFTDDQVPAQTTLTGTLTITNFALWQIGLLALVFQEINRGYVGVGGGTRKGQGQMAIAVPHIDMHYPDAAYDHTDRTGIVSAQARLAAPPWSVHDVPASVRAVERSLVLLPDVDPQPPRDWREQGMRVLHIQEDQVTRLFQEAVQRAWVPWIMQMKGENT